MSKIVVQGLVDSYSWVSAFGDGIPLIFLLIELDVAWWLALNIGILVSLISFLSTCKYQGRAIEKYFEEKKHSVTWLEYLLFFLFLPFVFLGWLLTQLYNVLPLSESRLTEKGHWSIDGYMVLYYLTGLALSVFLAQQFWCWVSAAASVEFCQRDWIWIIGIGLGWWLLQWPFDTASQLAETVEGIAETMGDKEMVSGYCKAHSPATYSALFLRGKDEEQTMRFLGSGFHTIQHLLQGLLLIPAIWLGHGFRSQPLVASLAIVMAFFIAGVSLFTETYFFDGENFQKWLDRIKEKVVDEEGVTSHKTFCARIASFLLPLTPWFHGVDTYFVFWMLGTWLLPHCHIHATWAHLFALPAFLAMVAGTYYSEYHQSKLELQEYLKKAPSTEGCCCV